MGEVNLEFLDLVGEVINNSAERIDMLDGNEYHELNILSGADGALLETAKGFASKDNRPYLFLMNKDSIFEDTGIAFPNETYTKIKGDVGDVDPAFKSLFYLGPDARGNSEVIIKESGDAILKRGGSCIDLKAKEYVDSPSPDEIYVSVAIERGDATVKPGLNHGDIRDKSARNILAKSGIITYGLKDAGISYTPDIGFVK